MTVDLAALAKLASEATPGPWRAGIEQPEDPVVWGPNDMWIANVGQWGANPTPDSVACADALFVAAASPVVVLALVRVALAARAGPADNEPDCTCDRDDDSDPGGALTLCPKHERMMRPLRWETLAMMVIDLMANEAALRAALADLDA